MIGPSTIRPVPLPSARTTIANDVRSRRNDLCPLRPVWLMHSTSTVAESSEGVALHAHHKHSASKVTSVSGCSVMRCRT